MGSSGFKLLGSNPGSLLRSKSTRHERRCEAASECLVYKYLLLLDFKHLKLVPQFAYLVVVAAGHRLELEYSEL